MTPKLILIAGPNGAGKSTLFETRVAPSFASPFINADIIQRNEMGDASPSASYEAAKIAKKRRAKMLRNRLSFATETVFSHPSKLDVIRDANALGYKVFVMHIGVESPDLSVARVAVRVTQGGHNVPEDKVRARYKRSGPLIRQAILAADHGFVYDNSLANTPPKRKIVFASGRLTEARPNIPRWMLDIYEDDLVI